MTKEFTLETFTTREAGRISLANPVLQRNWRRRNFLPSHDGPARFTALDIAEIWTLKLLSDRGIGPNLAKDVAETCGTSIVGHALTALDAWGGDLEERELWRSYGMSGDENWGFKARKLKERMIGGKEWPGDLARFFFWWADGSHSFHKSADKAFGHFASDPRYAGAVVMLDLDALGDVLLERAGRPIIHVNLLPGS